jgi:NADH-quinone oxidoreductase subunit E
MKQKLQKIFQRHYQKRDALIPILQDVQGEYGYLPPEAMEAAARYCRVAPVEVFGVSTFYAQFKFTPAGRNLVTVCQGTACHVMGGARNLEVAMAQLGIQPGQTSPDGAFMLETVACIGACALAPAMVVNKTTHGRVKPEQIAEILNGDGIN